MANKKGSKYNKLRGDEVATKESEAAARAFMGWFGNQYDRIKNVLIYAHRWDDEVATDTALKIYENIALKGLTFKDKYRAYYLVSYQKNWVAAQQKNATAAARYQLVYDEDGDERDAIEQLPAPTYEFEKYERAVHTLREEMLEFVRTIYSPMDCALFEIYMELQPQVSYKKLAQMLGVPVRKVWVISAIRADLAEWFAPRREYLLTLGE